MKAITLWRPWPHAILCLGKDVENRGWYPPRWLVGQRIAIHAGMAWDAAGVAWIEATFGVEVPREPHHPHAAIVGVVRLAGLEDQPDNAWAVDGKHHWGLAEAFALPQPVRCIGRQGLWDVPPEELAAIERQLQGGGRA